MEPGTLDWFNLTEQQPELVNRARRSAVIIATVVLTLFCGLPVRSQITPAVLDDFQWSNFRTSPIDLLIDDADVFRHGQPELNASEVQAYGRLLDEIAARRSALRSEPDFRSTWEQAFFRFAESRQAAWENGSLTITAATSESGNADPFRDRGEEPQNQTVPVQSYSLNADILSHPHHHVGRPVVLYGIMRHREMVDLQTPSDRQTEFRAAETDTIKVARGDLLAFDGTANSPVAIVDTRNVDFTSGSRPRSAGWPSKLDYLPVLVKGWVVKLWDHKPLIYCESVREISVQPPRQLIQQHSVAQQPIKDSETWLYYETLSGMQAYEQLLASPLASLVKGDPKLTHAEFADSFLNARLENLQLEMAAKAVADEDLLKTRFDNGTLSAIQYETQRRQLKRMWERRGIAKFAAAKDDHTKFETFVDVFTSPDEWQGRMVTLRGHVRHVLSYPAQHPAFPNEELHELWLYTDDSQSNPAVVVTPTLPSEFPHDADIVDHVTVTGCVFKQYVYRSQKSRRVAPLILASRVRWTPTDKEVLSLADSGMLAGNSLLAERARQRNPPGDGRMALLFVSFGSVITVMILWGRSQRERRDRRNLLKRMNGDPEFVSSPGDQYAPQLSDYTSGYDI